MEYQEKQQLSPQNEDHNQLAHLRDTSTDFQAERYSSPVDLIANNTAGAKRGGAGVNRSPGDRVALDAFSKPSTILE